MSEDFEKEMQRAMAAMLGRDMDKAFGVTESNVASESVLDVGKVMEAARKALLNFQRNQVTFVVDRAHQGAPVRHETPNDGQRIELSWLDANRIHQEWPLQLHKVLSEDAAEFVPLMMSGVYVPKILEQPPYEVPDEESFEDWLKGS